MSARILLCLLLFTSLHLAGQEKKQHHLSRSFPAGSSMAAVQDTTGNPDRVPQKDLTDLLRALLHRPPANPPPDDHFARPVISVVPAIGYTLQSRLAVTLAGNAAFRLSPRANLSTITASMAYTQNKQFTMPIESSIWTRNNRYNLVGDLRLYRYPQSTFGLGSGSSAGAEDPMDYHYFRLYEVILRQVAGSFYAGAGYLLDDHWNIWHRNEGDLHAGSYAAYGTATHTISSGFTCNLLNDSRDNAIHPTTGFYAALQYRTSIRALGSTANWHSVIIDVRKYGHFPAGSQNILAFWNYNWLILGGKPPYLDLPATSWDAFSSTGRGYIQGRFRGTRMVYGESEYRFGISRNGLLGGVVFLNAQSLAAGPGSGLQKVQPGFGTGLRIQLNKVSHTNISIDYGFGTQGSKGLFINIGELF